MPGTAQTDTVRVVKAIVHGTQAWRRQAMEKREDGEWTCRLL